MPQADNDTGIKPSSSMFSSFAGFGKDNGKSSSLAFSFLSSATNATNGDSSSEKENSANKLSSTKEQQPVGIIDDKNQMNYYGKLKGLNQSVAEWIQEKVKQNPFCILTPIFDDYAKHLNTIKETNKTSTKADTTPAETSTNAKTAITEPAAKTFTFASLASSSTTNSNETTADKPLSVFKTADTTELNKGSAAAVNQPAKPTTFSFGSLTSTAPSASTFSFGGPGVKPFTFSNVAKPIDSTKPSDTSEKEADADEDQPPKYEFVPVVEKDSFYSKRCKVFVKGDNGYADRGVGMLYLKKVEGSVKTQLLVRADTSLGKILLNILLSEGMPAQRMGKNNVMLVCLPLPDAQGPSSVLIRVKNEEEADDLLAEINKNKK